MTEIIKTKEKRVACDGSSPELGHPRVYLDLKKDGRIECPYCGQKFILEGNAANQ